MEFQLFKSTKWNKNEWILSYFVFNLNEIVFFFFFICNKKHLIVNVNVKALTNISWFINCIIIVIINVLRQNILLTYVYDTFITHSYRFMHKIMVCAHNSVRLLIRKIQEKTLTHTRATKNDVNILLYPHENKKYKNDNFATKHQTEVVQSSITFYAGRKKKYWITFNVIYVSCMWIRTFSIYGLRFTLYTKSHSVRCVAHNCQL